MSAVEAGDDGNEWTGDRDLLGRESLGVSQDERLAIGRVWDEDGLDRAKRVYRLTSSRASSLHALSEYTELATCT